jgi:hypothetical protein
MELSNVKSYEDYKAYLAELDALCRIEDGEIVFLNGHYGISLGECDSYERILHWVYHLSPKSWVTTAILQRFILLATTHHKLQPAM